MKHLVFLSLFIGTCFLFLSCGTNNSPRENEEENGSGSENLEFALGADISWVTEMESQGHKFYNAAGQERECTALMKECGLNAIRLRVWVDPSNYGGWCDVEDMVVKAVRAKDLGMDVMVDFGEARGLEGHGSRPAEGSHQEPYHRSLAGTEGQRRDTQVGTGGQRDTPGHAVGRRCLAERCLVERRKHHRL